MTSQASAPSPRPGWLRLLGRVIPGIEAVHRQTQPFAAAWCEHNLQALEAEGPLWVALGDSMTQGIGAASYLGGWVGQLQARLARDGINYRVVNLSVTGAHIADVTRVQIAQLREIGQVPDVVTVLAGANDLNRPRDKALAAARFADLLEALPAGPATVIATLPRPTEASRAINAAIERLAATGAVQIAETRGGRLRDIRGTLAEDFFHPNELGYRRIADAFEAPIRAATQS